MNKEEFNTYLDSTLCLLEKAKQLRYSDDSTKVEAEKKQLTDFFMDKVTELYLATNTTSSYKDAKYQEFLKNSAYILNKLSSEIVNYIIKTENEVTGSFYYAEQWKNRVCWRRSAIEALKEIYKNTSFEKFYYELDTEDLDDSIEMRAHKEGGLKEDQIPKGIPTSHWWWWSPEEPPERREDFVANPEEVEKPELENKKQELAKLNKKIANLQNRIKNLSGGKLTGGLNFDNPSKSRIKELEKDLKKQKILQQNLEKEIAFLEENSK